MILTHAELSELSGYRRPAAVRRWLERQRIPFIVGGDGWPRVAEKTIMERLGFKQSTPKPEPQLRLRNA